MCLLFASQLKSEDTRLLALYRLKLLDLKRHLRAYVWAWIQARIEVAIQINEPEFKGRFILWSRIMFSYHPIVFLSLRRTHFRSWENFLLFLRLSYRWRKYESNTYVWYLIKNLGKTENFSSRNNQNLHSSLCQKLIGKYYLHQVFENLPLKSFEKWYSVDFTNSLIFRTIYVKATLWKIFKNSYFSIIVPIYSLFPGEISTRQKKQQ